MSSLNTVFTCWWTSTQRFLHTLLQTLAHLNMSPLTPVTNKTSMSSGTMTSGWKHQGFDWQRFPTAWYIKTNSVLDDQLTWSAAPIGFWKINTFTIAENIKTIVAVSFPCRCNNNLIPSNAPLMWGVDSSLLSPPQPYNSLFVTCRHCHGNQALTMTRLGGGELWLVLLQRSRRYSEESRTRSTQILLLCSVMEGNVCFIA